MDVVHQTETWQGVVTVDGFLFEPGARLLDPPAWPERRMLFIGDSVTCGEAIASVWDHAAYIPDAVVVSLGTNDFNPAIGGLLDREEYVGTYVRFVRAIRSRYPAARIFLTEGAIVNDEADPKRPPKSVLREYIAETARRAGDPLVQVVESRHDPGDRRDPHPNREQHQPMARDLEPLVRDAMDWN